MKRTITQLLLALVILSSAALACGGSFSTATIKNAWMAADEEGQNPTTAFSQDAVFYAIVELENAPDDTTLKAVWTVVEAEDTEPNLVINETELTSGDGLIHFQLENKDYLWPVGKYKVDLYLNNELDRSLSFEVQ